MATKVYLPTDSLNLYTQEDGEALILTPASQCRIRTYVGDLITIWDALEEHAIVDRVGFADYVDEGGTVLGADLAATLLVLTKIIG